jgi:tRNA(Arg) A34 adenosine deaminase TadA
VTAPAACWADLEAPWQEAFEEAWASWRSGSLGIGAVVVGPGGSVLARGRNRVLGRREETGVLAGTNIAHAEVNALGQVHPGRHDGFRLLTTLEPCVMCAGAIAIARIPAVEFAAADPLFEGMHDHLLEHPFFGERLESRSGPWTGPLARFASLLPLSAFAFWEPDHPVVEVHRTAMPSVLAAVEQVLADGTLAAVGEAGRGAADALEAVWDLLAEP